MPSDFSNISFKISSVEAAAFATSIRSALGGGNLSSVPRLDSSYLIRQGQIAFQDAFENGIYGLFNNQSIVLPEDRVTAVGRISELGDSPADSWVRQNIRECVGISLVVYLSTKGPFTSQRFWLRSSKTQFGANDGYLFVAFPKTMEAQAHGKLIIAFADSISSYLGAARTSAIIDFCAASGHPIHKKAHKFAFRKAVHVDSFPKDRVKDYNSDLDMIFALMAKKHGVEWSEFKFFGGNFDSNDADSDDEIPDDGHTIKPGVKPAGDEGEEPTAGPSGDKKEGFVAGEAAQEKIDFVDGLKIEGMQKIPAELKFNWYLAFTESLRNNKQFKKKNADEKKKVYDVLAKAFLIERLTAYIKAVSS